MMQNQNTQNKLNLLATVAHEAQLLDKAGFETLIHETSPDVVMDILAAFKKTLQESISRLEHSDTSAEEARKVCHKLKGSSLLIGFVPLGELCKTVMNDSKNNFSEFKKDIENVLLSARETQKIVNSLIG